MNITYHRNHHLSYNFRRNYLFGTIGVLINPSTFRHMSVTKPMYLVARFLLPIVRMVLSPFLFFKYMFMAAIYWTRPAQWMIGNYKTIFSGKPECIAKELGLAWTCYDTFSTLYRGFQRLLHGRHPGPVVYQNIGNIQIVTVPYELV